VLQLVRLSEKQPSSRRNVPKLILHESDPRRQTTLKLQSLLQQHPNLTQACAARVIGVSRQRIQQINAENNMGMVQPSWLSWPCPLCGVEVRKKRSIARRINFARSVYCKTCQLRVCHNGHVDAPRRQPSGNCATCERERDNKIVRYRICIDCGKELPVTYNNERIAKYFGYRLERCKSCHFKRIGHRLQKYCLYGHLMEETRHRTKSGASYCEECTKIRHRAWNLQQKEKKVAS